MKGQALEEEQHDQMRIPADEKKNVPHETFKQYKGQPGTRPDGFEDAALRNFLDRSAHDEGITLIVLQCNTRSADNAFQRIVSHMHRQLDLLAQPLIQSLKQGTTSRKI